MPIEVIVQDPFEPEMKFQLGRLLMTPGALQAFIESGELTYKYLLRHSAGDYGEVDAEDKTLNDRAIRDGERILSAYTLPTGVTFWAITEWDRSSTTLLLPSEY
jgi:hypothetical protein